MKYGAHFRLIVGVYEDSYDNFQLNYFSNKPLLFKDERFGWIEEDVTNEFEIFIEDFVIDGIRGKEGVGFYEVLGEMWFEHYQDPYTQEWDVDYEWRNEKIIKLPEEAMNVYKDESNEVELDDDYANKHILDQMF